MDEKFSAALNFADYQDEQAIHRFTVAWQVAIDDMNRAIKQHWAQIKKVRANFTSDEFWDYWSIRSHQVRQENKSFDESDPIDKFNGTILNMVGRMAWSLWNIQLLRQARLPIDS